MHRVAVQGHVRGCDEQIQVMDGDRDIHKVGVVHDGQTPRVVLDESRKDDVLQCRGVD